MDSFNPSSLWKAIKNLSSWTTRYSKYVSSRFSSVYGDISDLVDDVYSIQKSIKGIKGWVEDKISNSKTYIIDYIRNDMIKPLSYYIDSVAVDLKSLVKNIKSDIHDVVDIVNDILDYIDTIPSMIEDKIDLAQDKIISWVKDKFVSIVEDVLEQEVRK